LVIEIVYLKKGCMSDKEKDSKSEKEKEKNQMDKELKQSFPASDPPSHSRPGHERDEEE